MSIHDRYVPLIIPQEQLVHGNYYAGVCRNARVARWDGEAQHFVHWRTKFNATFYESIEYWDPAGTFDQFVPVLDLGATAPTEIAIPLR